MFYRKVQFLVLLFFTCNLFIIRVHICSLFHDRKWFQFCLAFSRSCLAVERGGDNNRPTITLAPLMISNCRLSERSGLFATCTKRAPLIFLRYIWTSFLVVNLFGPVSPALRLNLGLLFPWIFKTICTSPASAQNVTRVTGVISNLRSIMWDLNRSFKVARSSFKLN